MRDAILGIAISLALLAAFSVGKQYGLKNAPEYVAMKEEQQRKSEAELAAILAEYEASNDDTCEKIFDLVIEDLTYDTRPPEGR